MINKDALLKALYCRKTIPENPEIQDCENCPYYLRDEMLDCDSVRIFADAHDLLKEQDAVEPKQVDLYGKDEWWGLVCVCPDCNAEWMSDKADTHFCPKCGQAVKWE
jgi:hypothetical protein